jgi:hypothetical protein
MRYKRFNKMPTALKPLINSPVKARALIMQKNAGKTPIGTPIFPGTDGGLSIDQVREFIQNQKRITGETFRVGVGNTNVQVELPGDARLLLGIVFDTTDAGATFDLRINNGGVIDNGSVATHIVTNPVNGVNFVAYNYPLTSKTSIDLVYTSVVGGITQHVDFIYI